MKNLVISFSLLLLLFSCQGPKRVGQTNPSQQSEAKMDGLKEDLLNTKWYLSDEELTVEGIYIEFSESEGSLRVSGFAGCNRFFGGVSGKGINKISFDQIGSTKKYCESGDAENYFLNLLGKTNTYSIKGNELKLYDDKLLLLKFIR